MAITPVPYTPTPHSKVFEITSNAQPQTVNRATLLSYLDAGPLKEFLTRTNDWSYNDLHIRLTQVLGGYSDMLHWQAHASTFVWSGTGAASVLTITLVAPGLQTAKVLYEMRYLYSNER